ncbi:MAG: hypothetical protein LBM01_03275 [Christensenellaceae bacterium]|jgi:hypothetical protein|nr:hypothetical protein [Christensenellaceae bacterium]
MNLEEQIKNTKERIGMLSDEIDKERALGHDVREREADRRDAKTKLYDLQEQLKEQNAANAPEPERL